jgi:ABC-type transporter MlaC component
MKSTLFALGVIVPVLVSAISIAHAVECGGGVVRAGCAHPHQAALAKPRAAIVAGPHRGRMKSASRGGRTATVIRVNTALAGCASRETACHRRRAKQVPARGGVRLDALTLTGKTAVSVVNDFGTRALAAMRNGDTEAARQGQFRLLYRQYFDTQACARSALGSYWQNATAQQRQEFVDRYEDYIVVGFSGPLGHLGGESFTMLGSRSDQDGVIVISRMNRIDGAAPIEFDWQLSRTSDGYKVTNVIVSGIDMASMHRSDMLSVIQRNSGHMQVLLAALRDKNASNGILR